MNILRELFLYLWTSILYQIAWAQGTSIDRAFDLVKTSSLVPYVGALIETKTSVRSKMRCGTFCVNHMCSCVSFVFDDVTKTCNMYSTKVNDNVSGPIKAYVKNTQCVHSTPTLLNGYPTQTSACSVQYGCDAGYTVSGQSLSSTTISCQNSETWGSFTHSCDKSCEWPASSIQDGANTLVLDCVVGTKSGQSALYRQDTYAQCYTRTCESGNWGYFQLYGNQQNNRCSVCLTGCSLPLFTIQDGSNTLELDWGEGTLSGQRTFYRLDQYNQCYTKTCVAAQWGTFSGFGQQQNGRCMI